MSASRRGLLEPVIALRLQRLPYPQRGVVIVLLPAVVHQVEIRAYRLAHRLRQPDGFLDVGMALLLVAQEPFRTRGESVADGRLHRRLRAAGPIRRYAVPKASDHLINRQAERFAAQIPQRHIQVGAHRRDARVQSIQLDQFLPDPLS